MNRIDDPDERIYAALWLASPQSVSEHSQLYAALIRETVRDRKAPGPVVVFEDRVMPIDELVEAFTSDSEFLDAALTSARQLGIGQASMGVILFSSTGDPLWSGKAPEVGLAFVGMFLFPAADAEEH